MKHNIRVTVHAPVGKFVGYVLEGDGTASTKELVEQARDQIQHKISELSNLTLFSSTNDAPTAQTTLPGELIRNSVLVFEIVSW